MNLNQVTIPSLDVLTSIKFYETLGLRLIVHTHDAYARFECPVGDATFSIHQVAHIAEGASVVVYFEVDNVAQKVSALKKKGITFKTDVTAQTWLWTEAALEDPDGNTIIIYHAGTNRKNPPWRLK